MNSKHRSAVAIAMSEPILELKNVKTHFPVHRGFLRTRATGVVRAVDGVSLAVQRGEVLGLVGESGCGKSTLARTILQLVPATGGAVLLEGRNLTASSPAEVTTARRTLQMIFQDPYASLNPRMTVFATLAEPMLVHRVCAAADVPAHRRLVHALSSVIDEMLFGRTIRAQTGHRS